MSTFTHYSKHEGHDWTAWKAGDVDGRALRKRSPVCADPLVEINKVKLHALKADDGREWDCINGWRVSAAEAQAPNTVPHINGDTSHSPADAAQEQSSSTYERVDIVHARQLDDASAFESVEIKVDGPVVRETVHLNPEQFTAQQSAQAYALRVWSGQSVDLKRAERIERIKSALAGQNLPSEGVQYPGSDDDVWTEEDELPVTWKARA